MTRKASPCAVEWQAGILSTCRKSLPVKGLVCVCRGSLAYLGLYYSEKILGGTYMELGEGNAAVDHLKLAAAHWRKYASSIAAQYKPWAAVRLRTVIDPKAY